MRSFAQFVEEGLVSERIHRNTSAATVSAIARTSTQGLARFVIDHKGAMHAGDGFNFTHRDLQSEYPTRVRGWLRDEGGSRTVMTEPPNSDHHHVQRMVKSGAEHGMVHDPDYV